MIKALVPLGILAAGLAAAQPSVSILSPSSIAAGPWLQWLSTRAQYVTGNVSNASRISLYDCQTATNCNRFSTINSPAPPYAWTWPSPVTTDILMKITADGVTSSESSAPFGVFPVSNSNPPAAPSLSLTCGNGSSGTLVCPTSTIPNDPPSSAAGTPLTTFSGYADPSIRRDPAVGTSNANGTNLWMLYSFLNVEVLPSTVTTSAVGIHLAESTDGGQSWSKKANVWPITYSGGVYSSHEVANFWPYTNASGVTNWYAVHLDYTIQPGATIASSIPDGNLVTTVASTPTGLASAVYPASQVLTYSTLNSVVFNAIHVTTPCQGGASLGSWGEPAITVQPGVGGAATAYLIAMCISPNFVDSQYYIFTNTDLQYLTPVAGGGYSGWQYYGGPFGLQQLWNANPHLEPLYSNKTAFITELDIAQRSDNSLVAVITPAYICTPQSCGTQSNVEVQEGCVAVDFNLTNAAGHTNPQPFGTAIATLTDSFTDGTGIENNGPNACTYEPTSLTGIIIVRRLLAQNYFVASLMDSGIMP